ncbi:MAG: exo-alpha-sialidase [Planctomycetaceae bacterium]|nr:exo-alpha-sialidase [Planctomycetales bacterium]MCB9923704.1 exo-alpha-sialidase [Planctomycetaceae bacterium]
MTGLWSRRSFMAGLGMTGIASLSSSVALATSTAEVYATRVISHLSHRYHGWPTLTRRANGELLVVCSGGRETHVCPFGRVELIRSKDEGQTWSWPEVVMDGPIDDRDAGVVETANGSLLVTTFTSLAYEPILQNAEAAGNWDAAKLARWQAANNRIDATQRQTALGVWMKRSTDGGITWSGRYDSLVNSPHGPIQLADGRLLYAGKDLWREPSRVGVCESTDDGSTWTWLAEIPTRTGDDHNQYHELHAVEAANGKIVVHIRNHNTQNARETLQCESSDGGKTWTQPHAIGVWGLPSHLLRLRDDRLVMSYGHRRAPLGNQARVSEDHGATWSEPLVLSSDGNSGDLGYPSTVELTDGSLLTVWYESLKGSPFAQLRQVHWKIA